MTVTTQLYRQAPIDSGKTVQGRHPTGSRIRGGSIASALKAALFGGLSQVILLGVTLMPLPDQAAAIISTLVTIPAFILICFSTGILTVIIAADEITCTKKGGEVAWMAGFWTGIFAAIVAMFAAAGGVLFVDFGQALSRHFSPDYLASWNHNLNLNTVVLTGRVFGALMVYGLIGTLISALLSSVGGMVWVKVIR